MVDDRGERYADGGVDPHNVFYPDPARIAAINLEWEQAALLTPSACD